MTSRIDRLGFAAVLATTMGSATFALAIFGVLPVELIDAFGLSRAGLGSLGAASSITGAVLSPVFGPFSDRVGARRATLITLALATAAIAAISVAPVYGLLIAAAVLSGVAQSGANPSTNKLISHHVPLGRRGLITGIKQSGVQIGTVLGGLLLPLLASFLGWRMAVAVSAAVPATAAITARWTVPRDPAVDGAAGGGRTPRPPLPPMIRRLAVYGFMLGAGGSAIFAFLSLYAQEQLHLDVVTAGRVVAVLGVFGFAGRIGWAHLAERTLGAERALTVLGALAMATGLLLVASPSLGVWTLWPAAALAGASASSWNSVGMLTVMHHTEPGDAGRGSGVVMFGFLTGLGLGAPVFGWSVDRTGSYQAGWWAVVVLFLAGTLTMVLAHRTETP